MTYSGDIDRPAVPMELAQIVDYGDPCHYPRPVREMPLEDWTTPMVHHPFRVLGHQVANLLAWLGRPFVTMAAYDYNLPEGPLFGSDGTVYQDDGTGELVAYRPYVHYDHHLWCDGGWVCQQVTPFTEDDNAWVNSEDYIHSEITELIQLAHDHGFRVISGPMPTLFESLQGSGTLGATNGAAMTVEISPTLKDNPAMLLQVLAHELGHVVLGHDIPGVGPDKSKDPRTAESEADQWAIARLSALGLPVDGIVDHDQAAHDPTNPAGQRYAMQAAAFAGGI